MTTIDIRQTWKHMFKLDPAKKISDEELKQVCHSGTDAIIVGGTDQVTYENVLDLLLRMSDYNVPCILEVSHPEAVVPGFDYYFIPIVLNSTEAKWITHLQQEAIKQYRSMINWDETFVEGYCIVNEQCKAFKKTNCRLPTTEDVLAYAHMAEHMFNLPFFYIEYSGTYGDPFLVQRVKYELNNTKLIYGGGITNAKEAKEMKEHADIIVVGNSIYDNFSEALTTVSAIQ